MIDASLTINKSAAVGLTVGLLERAALPTTPCLVVFERAVAIAAVDEGDIDVGSNLYAVTAHGTELVGRVVGIRAHRVRPEWSVIELDRPIGLFSRGEKSLRRGQPLITCVKPRTV